MFIVCLQVYQFAINSWNYFQVFGFGIREMTHVTIYVSFFLCFFSKLKQLFWVQIKCIPYSS